MTKRGVSKSQQLKTKREYNSRLKELQKVGLYEPKSSELTKYRKSRINKLYREYEKEIKDADILFIPFPKYVNPAKIREKTGAMNIKSTRKGVFFPKEGQRRGKIEYNKNMSEYQITLTGKTKYGKNRGVKIKQTFPIAPASKIERELRRLEKEHKSLKLNKNEYTRIRVTEPGNEGISSRLFTDWKELRKWLTAYKKIAPARLKFYRFITIEKVSIASHRAEKKAQREDREATKPRKVNRTGRSR